MIGKIKFISQLSFFVIKVNGINIQNGIWSTDSRKVMNDELLMVTTTINVKDIQNLINNEDGEFH